MTAPAPAPRPRGLDAAPAAVFAGSLGAAIPGVPAVALAGGVAIAVTLGTPLVTRARALAPGSSLRRSSARGAMDLFAGVLPSVGGGAGAHLGNMKSAPRWMALLCAAATILACFAGPSAEARPDQAAVAPPGPPPPGAPPPPPGSGLPDGQWVYTQQYGWIWMTTGDQYTYVPPGGTGEPLEYVYYGPAGWTWIAAPWVWGYGPRPYWGRTRPDRFAWYRRGDWRSPQRWHYAAAPERGEVAHHGVRPAPAPRGSRGEARPAPRAQGRGGGRGEGRGGEGRGGEGGGGEHGDGRRGGGRGER